MQRARVTRQVDNADFVPRDGSRKKASSSSREIRDARFMIRRLSINEEDSSPFFPFLAAKRELDANCVSRFIEGSLFLLTDEFRSKVACENEAVNLVCHPGQRLAIFSAAFGRTEYESLQCPQPLGVKEESKYLRFVRHPYFRSSTLWKFSYSFPVVRLCAKTTAN